MYLPRDASKKKAPSRHADGDKPKPHDEHKKRDKDVPVWLQLAAGAIAVLAFVGITDYHQLESVLGLQNSHDIRHSQVPTHPTAPSVAQSTGPLDPQDAATCTSAFTDIHLLETEAPTYSYSVEAQFYLDQSATFYGLGKAANTLALRQDLGFIQLLTLALGQDYRNEENGDPADDHSVSNLASLRGYESKTEMYCSESAGVSG